MNREELQRHLIRANINPSHYSLDGPASSSESYSLVADGDAWKVLYKERGQFSEVRAGISESDACQLIFQLLNVSLALARAHTNELYFGSSREA